MGCGRVVKGGWVGRRGVMMGVWRVVKGGWVGVGDGGWGCGVLKGSQGWVGGRTGWRGMWDVEGWSIRRVEREWGVEG